jgi:hypothetical protein
MVVSRPEAALDDGPMLGELAVLSAHEIDELPRRVHRLERAHNRRLAFWGEQALSRTSYASRAPTPSVHIFSLRASQSRVNNYAWWPVGTVRPIRPAD